MLYKKFKFFIILFFLTISSTIAQEFDDYRKPIIFFIETNPWSMVVGSDVPSFALYESGLVIYRVIENRQLNYYSVKLNTVELKELIDNIILSDEIYIMEEEIDASSWTDQPYNTLVINLDNYKVINVYGNLSRGEARDNTPHLFIEIYDRIISYRNNSAYEWEPPFIEVMLWNYDYAPNKRAWPENFPDINSPSTLKRGDLYSIFIERDQQEEFLDFYRSRGEREAVEINGYKMSISYRIPFPSINFRIN